MRHLRRHLLRHRTLALWLLLLALAMKLLVPGGFMVTAHGGGLTLQPCSGTGPLMAQPMGAAADHGTHRDPHPDHGGAEMPCAFSALAWAALAPIDPLVLAIALAWLIRLAMTRVQPAPRSPMRRLRPPLRGPPIPA